ncbi:adiponectin receptor protein-like [Galendromus occidentalis]|uniref:Adiponectin receptor protein-like n=1 Tax=Galendromus occidentalis TaxID=34638 RepID=A0AAJ6QRL5_9ACAR|nr:adiponectin receptor protein-like [Galendromus occidentalis]
MEELSCADWIILDTKLTASGFSVPVIPDIIKQAIDEDLVARCRKKIAAEIQDKFIDCQQQHLQHNSATLKKNEAICQVSESTHIEPDKEGFWEVCHYSVLPHWLQDNDFLLNGHRPPLRSFKLCFNSLFRIHTETVNIWSHLIGAFMFACTAFSFLATERLELAEYVAFAAFFLGVFTCFFISTLYHTMHCHSMEVSQVFSRLDYCGIVSIIAGCFTPWIHYLFWCSPMSKIVYMAVAYSLCVLTVNLTMWEKFGQSQFRVLRASIFTGLGLSCSIFPGTHFVLIHGLYAAFVDLAFGWLFTMFAVAMFGVALYAMRVPERFMPGKFDVWCHSHQFFHVAVIVGAYVHLHCLCQMARFRHGDGELCPSDYDRFMLF